MSGLSLQHLIGATYLLAACFGISGANADWWMTDPQDTPARWYNKVYEIPTWVMPIKDYNENTFLAVTVFSVALVTLSAIYANFYILRVYLPSAPEGKRNIGDLNTDILCYLVATFFTTFSFLLLSVGKIWVSFGVFHNLFEFLLLAHILLRQAGISKRFFTLAGFAYLMTTFGIVLVLPWPFDAVYFKFQGLVIDVVLSVTMIRLYKHNRAIAEKTNIRTPANIQETGAENGILPEPKDSKDKKVVNFLPPVHENIYLLVVAAVVHLLGNTLVTFSNTFSLWVIFQFSYAITFPLYAYFVVSEPDSSRINWYKVEFAQEALVIVLGFIVSGLCIAIGAVTSGVSM
ncbi:hypothetical protein J3Q64DRAFT_1709348 [Phycomyces blakesleeanus]|uniref:Uncharacterized protein n=2 Tax=Phycomyces blakesleeanus TaxID=4837 RepID=A0A162ZNP2_PHYB8|nr:hypothetical protein PHYBLDRAFT_188800 [Phycomyces blakesleeanus NRRL 1555(-)]OAD68071.1 hypothetical protein PHYBLDRAFT_188800 [Phycomyces blakesleeanus NRRL 1555(-)]|eukprot:XP_018286111.1 hypothetical protein PHYBLDRAFT_188800 [Phycomyces blakesleeanus NRRL 1555(-)]